MISTICKLFKYIINEKLPEIKTVDLYNTSIYNEKSEQFYQYPAIFLEFDPIVTTQYLNKFELARVNLKIHVAIEYNKIEDINIVDRVSKALKEIDSFEFPDELFDPEFLVYTIKRTEINLNPNFINTTIRDSIIKYQFNVLDSSNADEREYITLTSLDDIKVDGKFYI